MTIDMLNSNDKIYIAGHRGMVGSAIIRNLKSKGYSNFLTKTHLELDLTDQQAVNQMFAEEKPDYVVLAAARVGGIYANNTYPADFIYDNLMIECNVIHAAYQQNSKGLLFLGSSCIYPRNANQPMTEDELLSGKLEATNEPYAVAKIAGIKLCESYNRQHETDFRSVMPTNLYGPNDNYHPENSHVIPALIRRIHEAKLQQKASVEIWGTGSPRREFLHVDDMAAACVHVMHLSKDEYHNITEEMLSHINVGCGEDVTIKQLAETISRVVGFKGELKFDASKPDGTPRKLLSIDRLKNSGWLPEVSLEDGLTDAYSDFKEMQTSL